MAIKNRTDLKSYFVKNAIPTEGNFVDLIESQLNQAQDGVFKLEGEPFSAVAAAGDQKRVLRLYAGYPAANPDWLLSLNPAQDPGNAATCKPGFGIADGAGNTRLFVEAGTGRIGIGTNTPEAGLDVVGEVRANGFRGRNDEELNDYRTVNPPSNVCLHSPGADRDAWIYRDSADSAHNWGIYHRQIDEPVAGLPPNSIGFIGGANSNLQAYVNLNDGSAFFAGDVIAGSLTVDNAINAPGGLIFEGAVAHVERDGALYRNIDGQCYLTVDDHFYIRDTGASSWAAHFDTNLGDLNLKGSLILDGEVRANGFRGRNDQKLADYKTVNPPSNVCLHSPGADRDAWIYRDSADSARNWGIYHRQIDGPVRGLPANSIGFIGGEDSDLKAYVNLENGSAFFAGKVTTLASDLAERFEHHEDGLEPGDVLTVDPRSPERLIKSRSAHEDGLAGVVSERPGFVLGVQWESPESGMPLALAGRVPVKVNLEGGPISIGDYLTSSSQPGVAMRTTSPGKVIGLAMQAFNGGSGSSEGKVVVLINLHWFGGR